MSGCKKCCSFPQESQKNAEKAHSKLLSMTLRTMLLVTNKYLHEATEV